MVSAITTCGRVFLGTFGRHHYYKLNEKVNLATFGRHHYNKLNVTVNLGTFGRHNNYKLNEKFNQTGFGECTLFCCYGVFKTVSRASDQNRVLLNLRRGLWSYFTF